MALIEKLTNIADSIRAKTGSVDPLTLDQMAAAIAGIAAGGSVPGITVDTVVMATTTTGAATTYEYISTLFPELEQAEPFITKILIVKNLEEAKRTNNHLLVAVAHYMAAQKPNRIDEMVRFRDGGYSTAFGSSDAFDLQVNTGDEFLMVTLNAMEVWA